MSERCDYLALHWRCGHAKGHSGPHEFIGEPPDPEYFKRLKSERAPTPSSRTATDPEGT